jgi:hypothetical protein
MAWQCPVNMSALMTSIDRRWQFRHQGLSMCVFARIWPTRCKELPLNPDW